jgi:hypothetical protein
MKLTSTEAFELSRGFRGLSVALGDFRFARWDELKPSQKRTLEDAEWSLLNASSDMITTAVGLVLDETEMGLDRLKESAARAEHAIRRLSEVRGLIKLATAAVGLSAAIVSGEPAAIAKRAKELYDLAA